MGESSSTGSQTPELECLQGDWNHGASRKFEWLSLVFKIFLKTTIAFSIIASLCNPDLGNGLSAADLICHYCFQLLIYVLTTPHIPHQLC